MAETDLKVQILFEAVGDKDLAKRLLLLQMHKRSSMLQQKNLLHQIEN